MSWDLRWIILFWCVLRFHVNTRHLLGFPTVAAGQDTSGNILCGFVFSAWLRLALGFMLSVQSMCGVFQATACQSLAFRSVREEVA